LILYLDTSAIVKLYAEEAGSEIMRRAIVDCDLIAISLLSYAETRSALARKARGGEITRADLNNYRHEFERDWSRIHRLPIGATLIRRAGDLAEELALRAFDALHLASADSLQAAIHAPVVFACFDAALNGAAQLRGLRTLTQA
jgi:uncharacterized protein